MNRPIASAVPNPGPPLLASAVAGACVALGPVVHRHHNADSLIPVFVSLYRWTPYCWGQDRYGTLTPLLAAPVADPFANLVVQTALMAGAGVLAFFLAARWLVRDPSWPAVGGAAGGAFLAGAGSYFQWTYLTTFNVFAVSLAFGLGALLVVSPGEYGGRWPAGWRWGVAGVLMALAAWVNSAIGVYLAPLAGAVGLGRWAAGEIRRRDLGPEVVPGFALAAAAVPFAVALQRISPHRTTFPTYPPAGRWGDMLLGAAGRFAADTEPAALTVVVLAALAAGLCGAAVGRTRADTGRSWALWAAALAALVAFGVPMTVLFTGQWRYSLPGVIVLFTATVGLAVRPVLLRLGPATLRRSRWVGAAAVVAGAVAGHGWPNPAAAQEALEASTPAAPGAADDLVRADCTHMTGNYWRVWPAVFLANCRHADAGDGRVVWAVAIRSVDAAPRWMPSAAGPGVRVGALTSDPFGRDFFASFGGRLREAERVGVVTVYVRTVPPP